MNFSDRSIEAIRFHCPTDTLHRTLFHKTGFHHSIKSIFKRNTTDIDTSFVHRLLSPWDSKSDVDRLFIFSSYYTRRRFIPFTVRFGERVLKSVEADPGRVFHILRNRLVELNRIGPVVLVLESGTNGVFHLHGLVDTVEDFDVVRTHLQQFGGYSTKASFRNLYQVVIKNPLNAVGWANYLVKELIELPEDEQRQRVYLSRSAAKIGREQLDHLRQQCEDRFSVRPELRGRAGTSAVVASRDEAGRFCSSKAVLQ